MIINGSCVSQFLVTILNVTSTIRGFQTSQLIYASFTPLTNSMAIFTVTNIHSHYGVFCFKHGCYIVIFITWIAKHIQMVQITYKT